MIFVISIIVGMLVAGTVELIPPPGKVRFLRFSIITFAVGILVYFSYSLGVLLTRVEVVSDDASPHSRAN